MSKVLFASEKDLCAAFIHWARGRGYKAYPETAGFDTVLVDAEQRQIGVEAKKQFNLKVLTQALRRTQALQWGDEGPDFRAIICNSISHDQASLCRHFGVVAFEPRETVHYRGSEPVSIIEFHQLGSYDPMFDWNPAKRLELPPCEFDADAGVPSPSQMTKWKQAALQVIALLEIKGFLTRADFKDLRISTTMWMNHVWLKPGDERGQWVRKDLPRFELEHPEVYEVYLAKERARLEHLK